MTFVGVEECNDEENKAVPSLPLKGIEEGKIERCRNSLLSLRHFLYPPVSYEVVTNTFEGRNYLLVVVPRQSGGPFMVSDRAEKEKSINLKAGRYIRMEAETRLARVSEEYDLLRKFSAYHFSSQTNSRATIDDIDFTYVEEYVRRTSGREIMKGMDAAGLYSTLNILDRNDPAGRHVHNFAVLMFSRTPEAFIPYSYIEIIVDWYGTKRKMETKYFKGPIWKQYESALEYLDTFLSTMVIRDEGRIENRSIDIFPKVALEELLANAIVHKNYENGKAVQIYVSRSQINIVNYNRPLPPVSLRDLNERTVFSERDTEGYVQSNASHRILRNRNW